MRRLLTTTALLALSAFGCGKGGRAEAPDTGAQTTPDTGADVSVVADGGTDMSAADAGSDADAGPSCSLHLLGPNEAPFDTLAKYCLFGGHPVDQVPSPGVIPYVPIARLYADKSLKQRFIAVPAGEKIHFDPMERYDFPQGTTLIKTFYYPNDATDPTQGRRLLETRLIVHRGDNWVPYIYKWNEAQTEAKRTRVGGTLQFDRIDEAGTQVTTTYRIPNENMCKDCHEQAKVVVPLGPRTYQLNRDYDYGGTVGVENQLKHWSELGLFENPPSDPSSLFALTDYTDDTKDIDKRARSYLEANCSHCHNPDGAADPSGLRLAVTVTDPREFGVCRTPVAAGGGSGQLYYDIVPGDPDHSIVVYRMSSTDPEVKMPELPTLTADDLGVKIVRQWITQLTPAGCPTP